MINQRFYSCSTGTVSSICKQLKIPHFTANWQPIDADYFNGTDSFTRNLFPNSKLYSTALYEIVKSFHWRTFAIIYDNSESLLKLQNAFIMTLDPNTLGKPKVSFFKLPEDSNDYKPLLKSISKLGINQVLIDCSLKNTFSLLEQSTKANMMNEYVVSIRFFFSFFRTSNRITLILIVLELFSHRNGCIYNGFITFE